MAQELPHDTEDSELPTFGLELVPIGDLENAEFRTRNDPGHPYQRENVIHRQTSRAYVSCKCIGVAHGYRSADFDELASLVVLGFRFEPSEIGVRLKHVRITVKFAGEKAGSPDPVVHKIAPNAFFTVEPTSQAETVDTGATGEAGVQLPGTVEVKGSISRNKKVERTTKDAMKVQGLINWVGKDVGDANAAQFVLMEDETARRGVPTSMQAAILLRRVDMRPFRAEVEMEVRTDFKTRLMEVFGTIPKDDPVLFNPEIRVQGILKETCDTNALESEDIDRLLRVTVTTELSDTTPKRGQVE